MSRYIDEEKFLDNFNDEIEMGVSDCSEAVNNALNNTVTADVTPVIHAHWEKDGHLWKCSNCEYLAIYDDVNHPCLTNYCSRCGAIMDGMDEKIKDV